MDLSTGSQSKLYSAANYMGQRQKQPCHGAVRLDEFEEGDLFGVWRLALSRTSSRYNCYRTAAYPNLSNVTPIGRQFAT